MKIMKLSNEMSSFTIRYRAICKTCLYKSSWFSIPDKAWEEASKHMQKPGMGSHIVEILTEQKMSLRIV